MKNNICSSYQKKLKKQSYRISSDFGTAPAFTIIELLIVIVIIGILSTVGIASFASIQSSTRDSQRSSKVTVIIEALEKYYDKNGEYPSCTAMSAPANTVASNTLKGVDLSVLSTPSAASGANSILAACASLTAGIDAFAYIGDGSAACSSTDCLQYTLQYREESTGNIISVTSRRKTNAAILGNITNLAATPVNFTQINLNWGLVNNATDYTVQRATNSGFTTGLVQTNSVSNSTSITGLTANTSYYFRVASNSTSGLGNWSNVVNTTTPQLATPVATATASSPSQITLDWGDVPLATSYTAQLSTSSSFTSPTIISGLTTSVNTFTGLTAGITYYLRVEALATGDTSDWSSTVNVLLMSSPVATATANSPSQITLSWGGVTGAASYTVQLSTSNAFTSPTVAPGITANAHAFTGLASGTVYYMRVQAVSGGGTSGWSNTASKNTYYSIVAWDSRSSTTNSFSATVPYNSGGYTGTLSKNGSVTSSTVQTGGSYTPANSFTATSSRTSSSNNLPSTLSYNSGGYTGTLYGSGSYVSSGSAAGSKYARYNPYYYNYTVTDWCIWSASEGTMWYQYSTYSPQQPASSYWYNDGTYSGTLYLVTWQDYVTYTSHATPPYNYSFNPSAHSSGSWYITAYHYKFAYFDGTAYKPDTRYYSQNYSGTVTKPAVDTRTWSTTYTQNYSGTVTKP